MEQAKISIPDRPTMLPMISINHVMTKVSCSRDDTTKIISGRHIVLFLMISCLVTFLCIIYRNIVYLNSYDKENWEEKMRELQKPVDQIECYFRKCKWHT